MNARRISKETLVQRRHQARLEKKKENERFLKTTGRDLIEMLQNDLSAFGGGLAQMGTRRETEPEGEVEPELPSDEVVGPFENEAGVRLLMFARDAGTPVVANFGYKPTKAFEHSLRHSAKIRGWRLHFYRLIDGIIAIEVEPRDARFSRRLGIHAVGRAGPIT